MALQARQRIGRSEDQGIRKVEVDPVDLVQDKRIGVQDFDLGQGLDIRVHAYAEGPILIRHPEACKGWGGIEALQMEGEQRGGIRLVPGGLGEDHRHQHIDQLLVLDKDGLIGDGFQQLRSLAHLVLHHAGDGCLDGMLGSDGLLPEGNEGRQTQLTDKREGLRMDFMRKARVQRHKRSVLHDRFPISLRLESSPITLETRALQKNHWTCEAGSMSPRVSRSTSLSPPTSEEETFVCLRRQRSHATVKALQSRLQWTCRMLSESSHAPFLRWCSIVASHRKPHGVANTMIEACTAFLVFTA